jgi:SnoaL-like domain
MEPWEVVAREEIRELIAQYTHFGDSGRLADLSLLFHPDATFHIVGEEVDVGREAVIARLGGLQDQIEHDAASQYVRHHISNLHITFVDATEAHSVAYWQVINGNGLVRWGRYRDSFRRIEEDPWLFASRQVRRDLPSVPA